MDILFIEDEEYARVGLAALLKNQGHQVTEVKDLDAALTRLQGTAYGLILLDVMLPPGIALSGVAFREAGKEFARRLRDGQLGELATSPDVPIVAITAVSDINVLQDINGFAQLTLQKPIDPEDAVAQMAHLLKGPTR